MRLLVVTSLLLPLLVVSACSNRPQTVVGNWSCTTIHPGGFTSSDTFRFGEKGELSLDSNGVVMHGSYEMKGTSLAMQLSDVPVPNPDGRLETQAQSLQATIQKLTDKELSMEVSTGNNRHKSQCSRS